MATEAAVGGVAKEIESVSRQQAVESDGREKNKSGIANSNKNDVVVAYAN